MCAAAVMQSVNPEAMAHRNLKEREFIVYLSPEEDWPLPPGKPTLQSAQVCVWTAGR